MLSRISVKCTRHQKYFRTKITKCMKVAQKVPFCKIASKLYNSKLSTIFGVEIQMCKNIILENFLYVFLFLLNRNFVFWFKYQIWFLRIEILTNVEIFSKLENYKKGWLWLLHLVVSKRFSFYGLLSNEVSLGRTRRPAEKAQ